MFLLENLPSSRECDGYFYEVPFGIDFGGNQRKPFFFHLPDQMIDIFFMEEYLPIGSRVDTELMGEMFVRGDVEPFQDGASGSETHVTPFEIALLCSHTLHFRSRKLDSCLIALHDFVIEQGFFIDVK